MELQARYLLDALYEARNLQHLYDLNFRVPDGPAKSIEALKQLCRQQVAREIRFKDILLPDHYAIKGVCTKYDDHYEIGTLQSLNRCWKRFVTCKELFHVLLDDPEFENLDLGAHFEQSVLDTPNVDGTHAPSAQCELIAEYGAIEFMFPFKDRIKLAAQGVNSQSVAETYLIPRIYVERYLSVSYMDFFEAVHKTYRIGEQG